MSCDAHRQGHPVKLPRITVGIDLAQLHDPTVVALGNIETPIVRFIFQRVRSLWPESKMIQIDHWHINPLHAPAVPGILLVEVCVTLWPTYPEGDVPDDAPRPH